MILLEKKLKKPELIERIAVDCNVSKAVATRMLKVFERTAIDTLKKGGSFQLVNFFKLTSYRTKPRTVLDMRYKSPIRVKSRIAVKFKAGHGLQTALN
jgi:nucleoid DNA-binding protein